MPTRLTRREFLKTFALTAAALGLGAVPVAEAPEAEAEPYTLFGYPIEMTDGDALEQDDVILGDFSAYTGWIPVDSFDRLYIMLMVGDMEPGVMVDCYVWEISTTCPVKRLIMPGKHISAQERAGDSDSLFTIEIDKDEVAPDCDYIIPEVHVTGGFADVACTAYVAKDRRLNNTELVIKSVQVTKEIPA